VVRFFLALTPNVQVQQVTDEEMRFKIVDEIFDQIDVDDSGTISM